MARSCIPGGWKPGFQDLAKGLRGLPKGFQRALLLEISFFNFKFRDFQELEFRFLWSFSWSEIGRVIGQFLIDILSIAELSRVCDDQVRSTWDRKGQKRQVGRRRLCIGRLSEVIRKCNFSDSFLAVFFLKNEPVFEQVWRTDSPPPTRIYTGLAIP